MPVLSRRSQALSVMAVAAIVIAIASIAYLRPGGRVAQPAPRPQTLTYPGPAQFLSARTGWVALNGAVLATSDGGRSWRRMRNLPYMRVTWMRLFDERHGLVLGFSLEGGARVERLLRTDDGGAHWTDEPLPSTDFVEQAGSVAAFTDRAHGWYVPSVTSGAGPQDLSLYRTDDGGTSWTRMAALDYLHPADHGLIRGGRPAALGFTDGANGWLVQTPVVVEDAVLSMTTDGGANWQTVALPPPQVDPMPLSYIAVPTVFPDGTALAWAVRGFMHGTAYVYRSADRGRTWATPLRLEEPIGAPAFVDSTHWWRGAGAVAARTSDAGRSWRRGGQAPDGLAISWLQPVSDRSAWAIGVKPSFASAELLRTDDGGGHWAVVPLDTGS
jgi:photosystem II stability/assembly factor-like uncharacterized protein